MGNQMLLLVTLAVACAAPLSKAASLLQHVASPTDAGAIAASLSEPGAAYLLAAVLPLLEAKVGALNIPDLPFNQDGFEGSVNSIKCQNLVVASSGVTLAAPGAVDVALSGVSVACSANWDFKLSSWPHFPDGSGSVDIAVSQTTAAVGVTFAVAALHPQLVATAATVNVGSIDLTFHGSVLDWILNLFKSNIENAVRSALQNDFGGAVSDFLSTDVNKELAALNLDLALAAPAPYNISEARFGFVQAPAVAPGGAFIAVAMQGDVVPIASPDAPLPLPPPALPPLSNATAGARYVAAYISPYTLLSAAYTYFSAGLMQWRVAPADIPLGFNSTSAYALIAPGFAPAFPAGAAVALAVTVSGVPGCAMAAAGGVAVDLPLRVAFQAQLANGSFQEAFVLNVGAALSLALGVAPNPKVAGGLVISGKLGYVDASVSLNETSVGAVNAPLLGFMTNLTIELVLVPVFNELLAVGIPLPAASGLTLTNASIAIDDGFAVFSSDFLFAPSASGGGPFARLAAKSAAMAAARDEEETKEGGKVF
jgi:LBP / BPI / CETP family, C-terminal domain